MENPNVESYTQDFTQEVYTRSKMYKEVYKNLELNVLI